MRGARSVPRTPLQRPTPTAPIPRARPVQWPVHFREGDHALGSPLQRPPPASSILEAPILAHLTNALRPFRAMVSPLPRRRAPSPLAASATPAAAPVLQRFRACAVQSPALERSTREILFFGIKGADSKEGVGGGVGEEYDQHPRRRRPTGVPLHLIMLFNKKTSVDSPIYVFPMLTVFIALLGPGAGWVFANQRARRGFQGVHGPAPRRKPTIGYCHGGATMGTKADQGRTDGHLLPRNLHIASGAALPFVR
ncbi:hypothetical protein BDK51DRAFT_37005 [Blyttiomyces helicus]|uniref:Uncharacterized protein n=1 Tax=Blyttiomyces helicus TaxID=388810 RepID=A0A4P9VZ64_9FUNG|nr:hypothetical protein BDK51DRAFT_37005 [Blyttiomyces helicus]|eukprot:RKO83638.1 hypothetical protein BDK51DRAFT_37005 [Blyttiomyces helicus]